MHLGRIDLALADGVEFCELLGPKALNGAVLTCDVMELGEPDASGRRSPVATGETVELSATTVICAVGEGIEKGWSKEECVERISFADRCLMDIGQPECMEYVQTNNVRKCYDYLMRKAEL